MKLRFTYLLFFILTFYGCATRKATVLVPPTTKPVAEEIDSIEIKKNRVIVKVDTIRTLYTIGLFLPLQLENHFADDTITDSSPLIIADAIRALQFYEGALAAKDSLASLKIDLRFKIFDCSGDSLENVKLINSKEVKKCDAVILMTASNLNSTIVSAANKSIIPFIVLQNSNTQILESNPNIWLATPSNSTQIRLMAAYLYYTFPSSQFTTVFRDVRRENDLASLFASVIDSLSANPNTCQKVNYIKGSGWSSLKSKLSKQKRNILIIPTSDESYLSSIITKLEDVKSEYTFLLSGLPAWENFEAIDPLKLQEFNAHFFSGLYIDSKNLKLQYFKKGFINTYHAYPSEQVFQGYDLVDFLVRNFDKNKLNYSKYKGASNFESPDTGFDFSEICNGCGRENKSISILKYGEFQIIKVK